MAGTGKSTLSKKLAEKYHLRYFSGGDVLKDLAKQEGYDVSIRGWWESPDGLKFLNERVNNQRGPSEIQEPNVVAWIDEFVLRGYSGLVPRASNLAGAL